MYLGKYGLLVIRLFHTESYCIPTGEMRIFCAPQYRYWKSDR